jgi:hypothetical protein
MKELQLEPLVEDGASERAKREVMKWCDIIANCFVSRWPGTTQGKHGAWQMMRLSATPRCHGLECHACNQLEFPQQGPAESCENWVKQLHQLGLRTTGEQRASGTETRNADCAPNESSQVEIELHRGKRWKQRRIGRGTFSATEAWMQQQLF